MPALNTYHPNLQEIAVNDVDLMDRGDGTPEGDAASIGKRLDGISQALCRDGIDDERIFAAMAYGALEAVYAVLDIEYWINGIHRGTDDIHEQLARRAIPALEELRDALADLKD